jgi:hypothetical protein
MLTEGVSRESILIAKAITLLESDYILPNDTYIKEDDSQLKHNMQKGFKKKYNIDIVLNGFKTSGSQDGLSISSNSELRNAYNNVRNSLDLAMRNLAETNMLNIDSKTADSFDTLKSNIEAFNFIKNRLERG